MTKKLLILILIAWPAYSSTVLNKPSWSSEWNIERSEGSSTADSELIFERSFSDFQKFYGADISKTYVRLLYSCGQPNSNLSNNFIPLERPLENQKQLLSFSGFLSYKLSYIKTPEFLEPATIVGSKNIEQLLNESWFYLHAYDTKIKINLSELSEIKNKYKKQIDECRSDYGAYIYRAIEKYDSHQISERIRLENERKYYEKLKMEEQKRDENIRFHKNIMLGIGTVGIIVLLYFISVTVKRLKRKSVRVKSEISNKFFDYKVKKDTENLVKKAQEAAVDEAARITVHNSLSRTVHVDDIQICESCGGAGCEACSRRGWTLKNT